MRERTPPRLIDHITAHMVVVRVRYEFRYDTTPWFATDQRATEAGRGRAYAGGGGVFVGA